MEVNHYETAGLSVATMTLKMPTFKLPTPFVPIIYDIQPVMPVIPALTTNHEQVKESLPSIPPTNPLPYSKPAPSIKPPDTPVSKLPQNVEVDFQPNTNYPSPSQLPSIKPPGKFGIEQMKKIKSQLIANHLSKIKFPPFLKHLESKHLQNEEIHSPFTKPPQAKWELRSTPPFSP